MLIDFISFLFVYEAMLLSVLSVAPRDKLGTSPALTHRNVVPFFLSMCLSTIKVVRTFSLQKIQSLR